MTAFLLFFAGQTFAQQGDVYDFTDGKLFYKINSNGTSVSVVKELNSTFTPWNIDPTGEINVPGTVTNNGTTYKVTGIANNTYSFCTNLTAVVLQEGPTDIGSTAFQYCSRITSVTLPSTLREIGYRAFDSCKAITSITVLVTDPSLITMGTSVFKNITASSVTLHVPAGCKAAYRAAAQWSAFTNIVEDAVATHIDASTAAEPAVVGVYDLNGHQLNGLQHGVNVVKYADGTAKKIIK